MRLNSVIVLLLAQAIVIAANPHGVMAQPTPKPTYLVHVAAGETTSDTSPDEQPKPVVVDEPGLGGKGMKVTFRAGGSIGQRTRLTDWTAFERLRFHVVNPGAEATLELNVLHGGSTNFATRVVVPLAIKSGKSEVVVEIDKLRNTNDSRPDLTNVKRWYLAEASGKTPTLVLGDLRLESRAINAPANGAPTPGVSINAERLARLKRAKMPKVEHAISFDTPEADAILAALETFPPDNPWNIPVDEWPLHPNSKAMIAAIGGHKPLRYNPDMSFVLVPPDQKMVEVKLSAYSDESDKGPYPVPDITPIEGWPANVRRDSATKNLTLNDVQRGKPSLDSDRHGIVVDPVNRKLYEFYRLTKTDTGWKAEQASIFDLASNRLRPDGWTSSDAAGLPIFPSIVRYDELKRGKIEHALRVTFVKTRRAYVYPATHFASRSNDETLPRMGERFRLRKDFDTSKFSPDVKTILEALKRYGMLNADNGIDWAISVAPDERIPVLHDELRKVKGLDFEVVTPPPGYVPPK
ncbi:MAG: hypothetical protein ACKV2Q_03280 [Planctomycetaceae bacterium]